MYVTDEYEDVYAGFMWSRDQSLIYIHKRVADWYTESVGVFLVSWHSKWIAQKQYPVINSYAGSLVWRPVFFNYLFAHVISYTIATELDCVYDYVT